MLKSIYDRGRSALHRAANKFDCPVLVLLYHRVISIEPNPYLLTVSPANFRAQIEYLSNNFPLLRFEADWYDINKPSVVITFDDGYADNLLEALPILEEFGVPATLFVTTDNMDTGKGYWWDEIEYIILGRHTFHPQFVLNDSQYGKKWSTVTDRERQKLHGDIIPLIKKIDFNRRDDWLRQFRYWAGVNEYTRISHRPMTVDELRGIATRPVITIGAHGVTHTALSSISPTQQKEELVISKKKLESLLGQNISVFAYPYGDRAAYTRESIRLCKDVGFSKAAANFPGQVHSWTDLYQIPRQMVLNWSVDTFAKKISAFWTR